MDTCWVDWESISQHVITSFSREHRMPVQLLTTPLFTLMAMDVLFRNALRDRLRAIAWSKSSFTMLWGEIISRLRHILEMALPLQKGWGLLAQLSTIMTFSTGWLRLPLEQ